MGLDRAIRGMVATASKVFRSVKCNVQHKCWVGKDFERAPVYAKRILNGIEVDYFERKAIVTKGLRYVRTAGGDLIQVSATITILDPVEPQGAEGRAEPVDTRDVFVLPDGTTGPIVGVDGGLIDKETGRPYMFEVLLG